MAGVPEHLCQLVTRHFSAAKQSKSLIFSHTELAVIRSVQNVPVCTVRFGDFSFIADRSLVSITLLPITSEKA
jgi:hypothetical protein